MAGLNPQTIGHKMTAGYAGSYARQPDMIVMTRLCGGSTPVPFGTPLVYNSSGAVVAAGAGFTAGAFAGVAGREFKSSLQYLEQAPGQYMPGEAVSVFQRGSIQVKCQGSAAPALGGKVYILVAASTTTGLTNVPVGSFVAMADSTTAGNTVQLTNAQWGGPADGNGIAELVILTRANA